MSFLYLGVRTVHWTTSRRFPHAVLPTSLNYRYGVSEIVNRLVWYHDFDNCTVLIQNWMATVTNIMLGVIMIARLHAMYQQSRRMLVFLVLIFSAVTIASVVIIIMQSSISTVSEEIILSGYSQCIDVGNDIFLATVTWIFGAVWEIVALCLAVWIAIKHFREVSTGRTIGDCFTALIKSHVFYFASFAAVTCLTLGTLSPQLSNASAVVMDFYNGLLQISSVVQMFVLGLRLVLSIRKFNAKVVANSDEATAMTSIKFRERTRMSTDNDV
ncbi:hypothetical protein K503DRAFT_869010 [Rhizopogon vinicolor AM-OR11-026]|uniref:G-protein coupled receptors family 3 profile domain-containing protein n=1 Tax=Rhizopogon vinicolor AM-OR11-026 TaxID=1314800 RepID=A0A1B7MNX2_9AGAM|nr:hypothetical protein K503DRAFT_869010 [Rhizopogon vinicolor AM-OR11-026]